MDINGFINGVGALTESCRIFYENFLKSGFTPQESLQLTQEYLHTMLTQSINQAKGPEEE